MFLLATKFSFEDFEKITEEKFKMFEEFAEFFITLGKCDVSSGDVLDEIIKIWEYSGESLQTYLCQMVHFI